ncbi:MAG: hypothetical protein IPJ31_02975 [Bacteroidetes bacterium]|nr:hypothetical protein [Bacteroidota bacterium]
MIFPKAKRNAKELGWHKTKDSVFGLYKGYFFNIADASILSNPQFKLVVVTTDSLTNEQEFQIKTKLDVNKKNLKYTSYEIGDNSILFQFAENFTFTKNKTVYNLFDFLVDLFKEMNLLEQNKCHTCGSNQEINFYDLNDTGIILCNTCFQQMENNFYEIECERILEEKNYFAGFLGSIVFSIPGIIAWVLLAVYLERLASAMAMILAFLGLKGYDYFNGQHGKLTKYIIVFTNIVSILIANVTTVIALLIKEGLTVNQAVAEFQLSQTTKDTLNQNIIISFVLAFFVWVWLLFVLKDKKLSVKPADKFQN